MSDELKQKGRISSLSTPLGQDKLVLSRFEGTEGLSELFEFRIEALSKSGEVDFDQLLGRSCTATMDFYADGDRDFDGLLVEAQAIGMREDIYVYRMVLRPTLWLLSRTTNCRIWHDLDAFQIISEVLGEREVAFRDARTRKSLPKLEYCVQYRETDFAFVSRLMEQHGIYYFFEHEKGRHTMVLCDAMSSHKLIPDGHEVRFIPVAVSSHIHEQCVYHWSSERRFRSGKVELRDYNFKTPNARMDGTSASSAGYAHSKLELYDYPGKHKDQGEAQRYAEIRLDAEQALDHRRYAAGEAPTLFPGGLVTITEHPIDSENGNYLVLRATHHFSTELFRSGSGAAAMNDRPYQGNYELLPQKRVFRAPLMTPKPVIHGPHTAKVVAQHGVNGEEIDTDEHGRIRVRFHWDRDDKRSCWVRVAQMWASNKWGGQFIPRIGMEVVVEFLEGDPDRPLVVGAVYNADNMYPYSLPANKTQSGVKSDSSKGHNGYNEVMLEDKKMSEQIRVHAEKDLNTTILNAETRKIGERFKPPLGAASRETTLLMGDDKLTIQSGNRETTVAVSDKLTIGLQQEIKVGATQSSTVGASRSATIGASDSLTVGVSRSAMVGASDSTNVGASLSETVGAARSTTVGGAASVSAGGAISLTSGGVVTITSGGVVTITAPAVKITGVLLLSGPPVILPF